MKGNTCKEASFRINGDPLRGGGNHSYHTEIFLSGWNPFLATFYYVWDNQTTRRCRDLQCLVGGGSASMCLPAGVTLLQETECGVAAERTFTYGIWHSKKIGNSCRTKQKKIFLSLALSSLVPPQDMFIIKFVKTNLVSFLVIIKKLG